MLPASNRLWPADTPDEASISLFRRRHGFQRGRTCAGRGSRGGRGLRGDRHRVHLAFSSNPSSYRTGLTIFAAMPGQLAGICVFGLGWLRAGAPAHVPQPSRQRCCAFPSVFVHPELYSPQKCRRPPLRGAAAQPNTRSVQTRHRPANQSPGPEQKVNIRGHHNRPAGEFSIAPARHAE